MAFYKVQLNADGLTLKDGHNFMIVEADDAAMAQAIAGSHRDADSAWGSATATLFAGATDLSPQVDGDGNTAAFSLYVTVKGPDTNASFEVAAAAADDVDALGDAMVVALNAHADIAGAAYATPNLTIAETTDGIGDHACVVELRRNGVALPGFVGAITDEGSAGAALAVALVPTEGVPSVFATGRIS